MTYHHDDADGDGVMDSRDRYPFTPLGTAVNALGGSEAQVNAGFWTKLKNEFLDESSEFFIRAQFNADGSEKSPREMLSDLVSFGGKDIYIGMVSDDAGYAREKRIAIDKMLEPLYNMTFSAFFTQQLVDIIYVVGSLVYQIIGGFPSLLLASKLNKSLSDVDPLMRPKRAGMKVIWNPLSGANVIIGVKSVWDPYLYNTGLTGIVNVWNPWNDSLTVGNWVRYDPWVS